MKKGLVLLGALLLLVLVGCMPREEDYVLAEITGHYTEQVLVNGKLEDRYYVICKNTADETDVFMVEVKPSTGFFAEPFEEQYEVGTTFKVLKKDKESLR
jgi:hypothetical protein